jgi:hypothetical protein
MTNAKYQRCKRALERFTIVAPSYLQAKERAEYVRQREIERDRLTIRVAEYHHQPSRTKIKGRPVRIAA